MCPMSEEDPLDRFCWRPPTPQERWHACADEVSSVRVLTDLAGDGERAILAGLGFGWLEVLNGRWSGDDEEAVYALMRGLNQRAGFRLFTLEGL